jgi:hypothetical protein
MKTFFAVSFFFSPCLVLDRQIPDMLQLILKWRESLQIWLNFYTIHDYINMNFKTETDKIEAVFLLDYIQYPAMMFMFFRKSQ